MSQMVSKQDKPVKSNVDTSTDEGQSDLCFIHSCHVWCGVIFKCSINVKSGPDTSYNFYIEFYCKLFNFLKCFPENLENLVEKILTRYLKLGGIKCDPSN